MINVLALPAWMRPWLGHDDPVPDVPQAPPVKEQSLRVRCRVCDVTWVATWSAPCWCCGSQDHKQKVN